MRPCFELAGDRTLTGERVQVATLGVVCSRQRIQVGYRVQRYKLTEELNAEFGQHAVLTGVTVGRLQGQMKLGLHSLVMEGPRFWHLPEGAEKPTGALD